MKFKRYLLWALILYVGVALGMALGHRFWPREVVKEVVWRESPATIKLGDEELWDVCNNTFLGEWDTKRIEIEKKFLQELQTEKDRFEQEWQVAKDKFEAEKLEFEHKKEVEMEKIKNYGEGLRVGYQNAKETYKGYQ